jgi:hypothetical protein
MMHGAFFSEWMLFIGLILLVPVWRICTRMGFSGWISVLTLVPLLNLALLYFLAFSDWPNDKKNKQE